MLLNSRHSITLHVTFQALIEQVTYGPAAMVCFFFGMTLLEGGSIEDAKNEVKAKFLSTYKVGIKTSVV